MPIDLKKYDGRYVEILYGSTFLTGKLIGNTLFGYYLSDVTVSKTSKIYEINLNNIDAIRDTTNEIYKILCSRIALLETKTDWIKKDPFFIRELDNNKKIKTELEEILKGGK